jgi:hypothetical protein
VWVPGLDAADKSRIASARLLRLRCNGVSEIFSSTIAFLRRWKSSRWNASTRSVRTIDAEDSLDSRSGRRCCRRGRLSIADGTSAIDGLDLLRSEEFGAVRVNWPLADWPSVANLLEEIRREQPRGSGCFLRSGNVRHRKYPSNGRLSGAAIWFGHQHAVPRGNSRWAQEHTAGCAEENESWPVALVGESREMEQIVERIRLVPSRRSTVLITGETGPAKRL